MGHTALSGRDNWETESGKKAQNAEQNLIKAFENTDYEIINHPTQLKNLYSQVQLSPDEIEQIYNPDIDISKKRMGSISRFCNKKYKNRENPLWRNKTTRRLGLRKRSQCWMWKCT